MNLPELSVVRFFFVVLTSSGLWAQTTPSGVRIESGQIALYDFKSPDGTTLRDQSSARQPLHLRIADTNRIRAINNSIEVTDKTLLRSKEAAADLSQAIRLSGEITIEAWIRPAKTNQAGPARIVTLSKDPSERNFTLGQDGDRYDVRFRTTKTSLSGTPSLSSKPGTLTTNLTHVVYTRERNGRTRIYLNGKLDVEQTIPGDTSNWDSNFRLGLANELSNDRPWLGAFSLVAIYSRDLLPHEVEQNFKAGPESSAAGLAMRGSEQKKKMFEDEIAPLLARHCLECHDSATRKGKLDLSKKDAALAGGKSGKVIVPGKASASLLWKSVESGEMPDDRGSLSTREKNLLRDWINAGATWSVDMIDPNNYVRDQQVAKNWARRLTVPEYIETVRSATRVDIAKEAHKILPKDLRADGFNNTAYNLKVDLAHIEGYAKLAETIVARMDVPKFLNEIAHVQDPKADEMRKVTERVGKWLLRGPLDEKEINEFLSVASVATDSGGDPKDGVRLVIEAMLQSPRFIYQIENQRGDGSAWPVSDYELASRMSYVLWGAPPDKALMKAADAGELYDRRGVNLQGQTNVKGFPDDRSIAAVRTPVA